MATEEEPKFGAAAIAAIPIVKDFPHGADTSNMNPSENVEDNRLNQLAWPPVPTMEQRDAGLSYNPDALQTHPAAASRMAREAGVHSDLRTGLEHLGAQRLAEGGPDIQALAKGNLAQIGSSVGSEDENGRPDLTQQPSRGGPQTAVTPDGALPGSFDPHSGQLRIPGTLSPEALQQEGHRRLQQPAGGIPDDPELHHFAEAFTSLYPLSVEEIPKLKASAAALSQEERHDAIDALRWARRYGLRQDELERFGRRRLEEMHEEAAEHPAAPPAQAEGGSSLPRLGALNDAEVAARDNPLSEKEIERVNAMRADPKHAWTAKDIALANRLGGDRFRSYTKIVPTLSRMAPNGIRSDEMRPSTNVIGPDGRPLGSDGRPLDEDHAVARFPRMG